MMVPSIFDGAAGPPPHAAEIATTTRHDPTLRVWRAVNTSPPIEDYLSVFGPVAGSRNART
jgi:hypothetical protein